MIAQVELLAWGRVVDLLVWSSAVIVVLLVAGGVMLWVRRRCHETRGGASESQFSLASLERMHQEGRISQEEFRRLRNAILGVKVPAQAPAEEPAPAGGGGDGPSGPPDAGEKNAGGELSPPGADDDGNQ